MLQILHDDPNLQRFTAACNFKLRRSSNTCPISSPITSNMKNPDGPGGLWSKEQFNDAPRKKGLPTHFSGRLLHYWSCPDFRRLIRLFDRMAKFGKGYTKLESCEQLIRCRRGPLTADEQLSVDRINPQESSRSASELADPVAGISRSLAASH